MCPNIETVAAERDDRERDEAIVAAMSGASVKTTLSAASGVMSSLSIDFMPSARVCSRPNGPLRLGPGRCCMRPMTRRSNQMTSSVETSR